MDDVMLSENLRRNAEQIPGNEAEALERITADFISDAVVSKKSPLDWLKKKFKKNKVKDSQETAEEIASHIDTCENNLEELNKVVENGGTRENWLEKSIASGAEVLGNEKVIKTAKLVSKVVKESNEAILEVTEGTAEAADVSDARTAGSSSKGTIIKNESAIKLSTLANTICKDVGISAAIGAVCSGAQKYTEIRQERIAGTKVENAAAKVIAESAKVASSSIVMIAIAGAIKYAAQNRIISALPENISGTACANIAFAAVEQVKIAYMAASGKITASEALEKSMDAATAAVGGIIGAELASKGGAVLGAKIGGFTGAFFGPAGIAIGAAVGGTIGRICGTVLGKTAGVRVGQMVSYGRKCIAGKATEFIKNTAKKVVGAVNIFRSKKTVFA